MKKLSIILTAIVFALFLFACNGNSGEPDELPNDTRSDAEIQTEEEPVTVEEEEKATFEKFEDYAVIKTKDELITEFGEENLKDAIGYYAEGTFEAPITTLTNPDNKHVITYVWDEDMKTSWIEAFYSIYNEDFDQTGTQKIETNEGLFLGMSLAELREWNGADFTFSGFGWDYEGGIYGNDDSRIKKSKVSVRLGTDGDIPNFAMGDVELSADDERLKDAKIIVSEISFHIN